MEFHIDSMVEELIEQGIPEAEARAAARRRFGNKSQKLEEPRGTAIARC
jgi:hypothetical protein